MNSKEREDLAIDFISFLDTVEKSDPATSSNCAVDMVKDILERNPKIRHLFYLWNKEEILTNMGLDYGKP